jgi:hypothetical protein
MTIDLVTGVYLIVAVGAVVVIAAVLLTLRG